MPAKSPYGVIPIPEEDVFSFLFKKQLHFPRDKVHFEDPATGRHYTHDALETTAIEWGKALRGVWEWQKGDVLAFYTPNCIDTPALTFGTLWAGGICSPANPAYTVDELAYQLKDSGARGLVTQLPQLKLAKEAAQKVGIPMDRIVLIGDERDPERKTKHFTQIRNTGGTQRFRKTKIDPKKDLAFLVYSSGTTGQPKGVMLSHYNLVSNVNQGVFVEGDHLRYKGPREDQQSRVLSVLPFYHIYGLTTLIHYPVHVGFTSVVMPKFDLNQFCATIQKHKITFSMIVPPIVLALAKHPDVDKYDLSSLKMLNSGAAPLSAELQQAVWDRLKIPVKQGYGLSETSPTTHSQEWTEEAYKHHRGSVGKLFPNMEAMYLSSPDEHSNEEAKEVPHGTPGELHLRGPNIFLGYWKRPEETAKCLSPDGWFRTGDVGFQDDDGHFYITDRVKELIKYKGFQVPPAELEGVLLQHRIIEDVAVVGVHSKKLGTEVPRAYVVRKGGMSAVQQQDAQEIIDWMAKKVVNHKRLRGGIKFVKTVPKSPSGKLLRRYLRDEARKEFAKEEDTQISAKL
ncbi:hypothetical protein UCRPC4_g01459 [Phaeomoniella chlamydospora]|uniref:Phenylacetyl-ligase n=1 Tax=Phaeomoniella chlamydospora TaxID=158046 RepID=A0A0G2HD42_PHACM|nr:hypothetical protein UCRPC4_g01459 [Phaeomoniella chlamydospora]